MKIDNTPTVTARRRALDTRKRLRVETVKKLRKKEPLIQSGLDKSKEQTAAEKNEVEADDKSRERIPTGNNEIKVGKSKERIPTGDNEIKVDKSTEQSVAENPEIAPDKSKKETAAEKNSKISASTPTAAPRVQKNVLATPPKPPSKFRKRQINKSWLPTHVYHAKRAHMTPPTEPLWRHAIPLTPTDKSYRATHRAVFSRGCVVWDTSYMSTIGTEGVEASLVSLLRGLGVEEDMLGGKAGSKWRRGSRGWEGWISERDGEQRKMTKVTIIWDVAVDEGVESHVPRKQKIRKMFLRVHPSSFFQVWGEILKVAKMQRPSVMVEDLRFEIGSIEVMGPGSTEALISALQPVVAEEKIPDEGPQVKCDTQPEVKSDTEPGTKPEGKPETKSGSKSKITPDTKPEEIWPRLCQVTNPASLPPNALLGFEVSDPRLHHPPRTVKSISSNEELLQILATWPPDKSQRNSTIFDRTARLIACRLLSSQKSINRRKGKALPGAYSDPLPQDPRIPVLLSASSAPSQGGQSSWTVFLPWKCVLPVWHSLIYYPLTTGENPRFGGLQEQRQILFEQGIPWFPGDFPGTKAGWEWERMERERRKMEWEKRPKGKRVSWESVDLGNGMKGEVGIGWACDWERLFQEGTSCFSSKGEVAKDGNSVMNATAAAGETPTALTTKATTPQTISLPSSLPQELPSPPLNVHHVTSPNSSSSSASPTALATISITLISRGNPTVCARIYRLPTTNANLREAWLAQTKVTKEPKNKKLLSPIPNTFRLSQKVTPATKKTSTTTNTSLPEAEEEEIPPHIRRQKLAAELLAAPPGPQAAASNSVATADAYPHIPSGEDLIGFVTTGNYDPSQGRARAIGCVALAKVVDNDGGDAGGEPGEGERNNGGKNERLCIVRDAGHSVGRLGRWKFI